MNETTSLLNEVLNTVIRILIIPLVPVVSAYLIALIKRKTEQLNQQVLNKDLSRYSDIAENAVITAVAAVKQTYVDALKAENGSLALNERQIAFEMAKEKIYKILGNTGIEALKKVYGNIDIWMENRIEYYVNQMKNQTTIVKLGEGD